MISQINHAKGYRLKRMALLMALALFFGVVLVSVPGARSDGTGQTSLTVPRQDPVQGFGHHSTTVTSNRAAAASVTTGSSVILSEEVRRLQDAIAKQSASSHREDHVTQTGTVAATPNHFHPEPGRFLTWKYGKRDFPSEFFATLTNDFNKMSFISTVGFIEHEMTNEGSPLVVPPSTVISAAHARGRDPTPDEMITACDLLNQQPLAKDQFLYQVARSFAASDADREFLSYIATDIPGTGCTDRMADVIAAQIVQAHQDHAGLEAREQVKRRAMRMAPLMLLADFAPTIFKAIVAVALAQPTPPVSRS